MGFSNIARYHYGTAVGYSNTAGGVASNPGATAVGYTNTATGQNSSAFGNSNNVTSLGASAFGNSITNSIANSTMIGPSDSAKMTILSSGFVGIGSNSPSEKLEVNGAIKIGMTATNNAGSMRWDGLNFQGYNGSTWSNFIPQSPPATACDTTQSFTVPGNYSYTVPASFGTITVRLWGGGGSGGTVHTTSLGNPGGISSIGSLGLFAGGGSPGTGGSTNGAIGGAGGIASGGSVNANGNPGATGVSWVNSGSGGSAPNGGAGGSGIGNGNGNSGLAPGGGGGGGANNSSDAGGGGSGAYVEKVYSSATLLPNTYLSDIIVGAGGSGPFANVFGGNGASGRVTISCASAGAAPINDRGVVFWNSGAHASDTNFVFTATGRLGIGTSSPQSTLDVNGTVRVSKYSAEPYACDMAHDSALAITSLYRQCICKGGATTWVFTSDGNTTCVWQ